MILLRVSNLFKYFFLAAIVSAECCLGAQGIAPANLAGKPFLTLPGEQWKLFWHDEFPGDRLDSSKWTSGLSWRGDDGSNRHHNREYASYISDDDALVRDGHLELLTRKEDVTDLRGKIYHYTQAFIQTSGKFEYTYGYCEVRVKVPTESGPGLWPAFWMLSRGWPPEDDVAEFWTGRPRPHTHQGYAYRDPKGKVQWDSNHKDSILDGYHTFGMEWGPGYQLFNRDGIITNRSYGRRVTSLPMYLILNTGVTSKPLPSEQTIFPNTFYVDYVRVYSRPSAIAIHNTGFESEVLAPWTGWNGAKIVSANAHGGAHALQVASEAAGAQQTIFGLNPKTTYRLTGWVDCGSNAEAMIGAKNFGSGEVHASSRNAGYKPLHVDFTTGADTTTASIYCYKASGSTPVFFDDITISKSVDAR